MYWLKKNNEIFDDDVEFFKQNRNKAYNGDWKNKDCYDSWEEFKIDVDFFTSFM